MRFLSGVFAVLLAIALPSVANAQFLENFDSYANGSMINGQGGWEGWDGDNQWDATVTDVVSFSSPHSLNLTPVSDTVQTFSGLNTGIWTVKVQTYIPSGHSGDTFFIILNTYDAGTATHNWSFQLRMNGADNVVESMGTPANPSNVTLPLIVDQWVEVKIDIDLDANTYSSYYGGTFLDSLAWNTDGLNEIQAFDLFCDGCTDSYFDDISLDPYVPVELQSLSVE